MKKLTAAILAAALTMTAAGICTAALPEKADGKVYAEFIGKRGIFPSGFSYSSGFSFVNSEGANCFSGRWTNLQGAGLDVVYAGGIVTSYSIDEADRELFLKGEAKHSYTEKQLASLAEKSYGRITNLIGTFRAESAEKQGDINCYEMYRYVNGVPLCQRSGIICLDSRTGTVVSCIADPYCISNIRDEKFPLKDNIMSADEALLEYYNKGRIGASPVYITDAENGTSEPFYEISTAYDVISAVTADTVHCFNSDEYYLADYYYTDDEEDDDEDLVSGDEYDEMYSGYQYVPLTYGPDNEEIREEYISPEKLLEKIRSDSLINIPDDIVLNVSERYSGTFEFKYGKKRETVRYVYTAEDGYRLEAVAYADTGKLISFSCSYRECFDCECECNEMIPKMYRAKTESAIKKYMGNICREYEVSEAYSYDGIYNAVWERKINGIPVKDNSVNIKIDCQGNIVYFSIDNGIYEGVKFGTGELITEKEALERSFEHLPSKLYYNAYTCDKKVYAELIYDLKIFERSKFPVNALTGEIK